MDKYLVDNRKQAKRWCFTLFTEDDTIPRKWEEHVAYCRWQLERCGETERLHLQGWLILKKINRLTWLKKKLNSSAHWSPCKGSNEANEEYCSKEETRVGEPQCYGTLANNQGKRNDIEAMRKCLQEGGSLDDCKDIDFDTYARYHICLEKEYHHIRTAEGKEEVKLSFENTRWKPWQQEVIDIVLTIPDKRTVNWYWDERGNIGKTYLTKFLVANHGAYLVTGGKQADILYAYNNEPVVVLDIARTYTESHDHFYTIMEYFKNGMYLNTKYVSSMRVFPVPHVFVFANFAPIESKMSADRWRIRFLC